MIKQEPSSQMITVILIGFRYSTNVLPTVTIDLYRAYRYFKELTTDLTYITDMKPIIYPTNMIELSETSEIGGDIAEFLETDNTKRAHNKDELIKAMGGSDAERVVIYYSGHGVDGNLLLPDDTHLSSLTFRSIITKAYPKASFFIITDCCNATGLSLPYHLESNHFKLSSFPSLSEHKMTLITSSTVSEKAVSDSTGSHFTKYLFNYLEQIRKLEMKAGLPNLLGCINKAIQSHQSGYKQTVGLYTSHPFQPVLCSWMWMKLDVEIIELLSCLKITPI